MNTTKLLLGICGLFVCFMLEAQGVVLNSQPKTFTYATVDGVGLEMDVYFPQKSDAPSPVILWMHGGGFSSGSRDSKGTVKLCQYATEKGYVAVSISYRLLRKGTTSRFGCDCDADTKIATFAEAMLDYYRATNFVIQNAEKWNIDMSKIIAGGSSAGAEAVANVVYAQPFFFDTTPLPKTFQYAGLFSCAGAIVSPNYMTRKNIIPSVFFHGTDDNLVPYGMAPHHLCKPSEVGYLMLYGSSIMADEIKKVGGSYYLQTSILGKHEMSAIPFKNLENVFSFFERTIYNKETVQTSIAYQSPIYKDVKRWASKYSTGQYVEGKDTLNYRFTLPDNFDVNRQYPLIIMLHGAGERGRDNTAQLIHGGDLFVSSEYRKEYPSIVIFPQCNTESYWARMSTGEEKRKFNYNQAPTKDLKLVMGLIEEMKQQNIVDNNRIYLGGLSMGGMGTLEMLYRMPNTFAAAFVICGAGNTNYAKTIGKTPIWLFHGLKDNVVSPHYAKEMEEALKKEGTSEIKSTYYPLATHNSWDKTFSNPDLLKWLFTHQK